MESAHQHPDHIQKQADAWSPQQVQQRATRLAAPARPLLEFWTKLNDDWVFNLSGLLAYNFLMSLFPILLILLAGVGLVLGDQAPETLATMQNAIEQMIPGGGIVFAAVSNQLANSAGLLLLIGVATSIFAGSRLFVVLENCFGIIFRVRGRDFIRQNLMAFGMLALYLFLVSIIMLGSTLPPLLLPLVDRVLQSSGFHLLTLALSYATSLAAALGLMYAVYSVVPNRPVRPREVWPGTLIVTVAIALYVLLFPNFVTIVFHPDNYGAVAGFAIVILLFFYYLAFILLVGAEINAWIAGERKSSGDIAATVHAQRARPTKRRDERSTA